jgi:hypothetical protein
MAAMLPDNRRPARPDWGLLAVAVVLVGGIIGVLLALLGIGP